MTSAGDVIVAHVTDDVRESPVDTDSQQASMTSRHVTTLISNFRSPSRTSSSGHLATSGSDDVTASLRRASPATSYLANESYLTDGSYLANATTQRSVDGTVDYRSGRLDSHSSVIQDLEKTWNNQVEATEGLGTTWLEGENGQRVGDLRQYITPIM